MKINGSLINDALTGKGNFPDGSPFYLDDKGKTRVKFDTIHMQWKGGKFVLTFIYGALEVGRLETNSFNPAIDYITLSKIDANIGVEVD